VKKAADDVDAALKAAEAERSALRSRLKDLRLKLDSPDGQPAPISLALKSYIGRLDEQEQELNKGAITTVATELDKVDTETKNDIPTTIEAWAQELRGSVGAIGQWKGLEFEIVRQQVFDETDPAKTGALDLAKTRDLTRRVQVYLLLAGPHQAGDMGLQVIERLEKLKLSELEAVLALARESLLRVQGLNDISVDSVASAGEAIGTLRGRLIDAVAKAATVKKVAKPEGLETGDFATAMTKFADSLQPEERAWGPGAAAQIAGESMSAVRQPASFSSVETAVVMQRTIPGWWDLKLSVPLTPVSGEQTVATASVIGASPGAVDIEWTIGDSVKRSGPGSQAFTPSEPGALALSVRGVSRTTGEIRIASAILQIRAAHGYAAVNEFVNQMKRDDRIQTIVAGVFIAAIGYAIFQGNWTGTFLDFFAAMLWGFSVDVSVAKVREIAGPLLARPVPTPATK
jgi:hypothetical protein